jgi:hypothetical protein
LPIFVIIVGAALIAAILLDSFETIVLPRRVTRSFRFTRLFYRSVWRPCAAVARNIRSRKLRDTLLAYFGPMSLILLLVVWAFVLIIGFALLQWGLGGDKLPFASCIYFSGSTFLTLGIGDVAFKDTLPRALTVIEAGVGFGFLAVVIGYLPVIYTAFSQREVEITLLDSRAGSPPSASELFVRFAGCKDEASFNQFWSQWERWAADILESHLSYPVLCFYRSQHDNQSWLSALTTILDASALAIVGIDGFSPRQPKLTFAIARHAVVDLSQVLNTPPQPPPEDRLTAAALHSLRQRLAEAGMTLRLTAEAEQRLKELRAMYEPYVFTLSKYLLLDLPQWHDERRKDNWRTSAWGRISSGDAPTRREAAVDDHF